MTIIDLSQVTWRDWISIISLVVSVLGIAITLWQVRKAQTASEAARDAARSTSDDVLRFARTVRAEQIQSKIRALLECVQHDRTLKRAAELSYELHEMLSRHGANTAGSENELVPVSRKIYGQISSASEIKRLDKSVREEIGESLLIIQEKILDSSTVALAPTNKPDQT